ncbi:DUF4333 domain-containing protein [Nocardioides sp. LS1]|uniref:DUF4333 domain-containing protein n=1 Tax=Nocardioides sp. LS1 TaxID=1027620 RepID=UPI000F61B4D6|nr:DUF4333 domain-containing protein [Nocardioides sp. LS1]GCD89992.1 hypothetical protein NLS1_19980 [Nocardioides sp. LS1]
MKIPALRLAAVTVCLLAATACNADVSVGGTKPISQADLEKQLTSMYTPDDPTATISTTCDGDLDSKVDATQNCHLDVGKEKADVRVTVTAIDGGEAKFDVLSYVPAETVAATVQKSLTDQGYQVDSIACDDELIGKVGEKTTCTAKPADGDGKIEATVSSVDGLMVNFDYKVVS